jgi:response regulator RpfG family c-di-GMP phosphodiesterase
MIYMAGKDEWNTVKTLINKVLDEDDAEKLVSSMRTSMSHDFEQILNQFAKKINEPVEILLIGNDPNFMRELIETFGRSKLTTSIRFTGAVEEARKMIFQQGVFKDFPIANIIIFDFSTLLEEGGLEMLDEIMNKKSVIKDVPVIILTDDFEKVKHFENYHPNLFLTKPNNLEEYKNIVESIKDFWLTYTSDTGRTI